MNPIAVDKFIISYHRLHDVSTVCKGGYSTGSMLEGGTTLSSVFWLARVTNWSNHITT
jgi:hypothetical protein